MSDLLSHVILCAEAHWCAHIILWRKDVLDSWHLIGGTILFLDSASTVVAALSQACCKACLWQFGSREHQQKAQHHPSGAESSPTASGAGKYNAERHWSRERAGWQQGGFSRCGWVGWSEFRSRRGQVQWRRPWLYLKPFPGLERASRTCASDFAGVDPSSSFGQTAAVQHGVGKQMLTCNTVWSVAQLHKSWVGLSCPSVDPHNLPLNVPHS